MHLGYCYSFVLYVAFDINMILTMIGAYPRHSEVFVFKYMNMFYDSMCLDNKKSLSFDLWSHI